MSTTAEYGPCRLAAALALGLVSVSVPAPGERTPKGPKPDEAAARVIAVSCGKSVGTCGGTVAALDCVLSVGATSGGLLVWFRMWSASNPEVVAYLEGKGGPLQLLRSASHCASGVWLAGVAVALLVALTPADPLGVLVRAVGGLIGGLLGAVATGLDIVSLLRLLLPIGDLRGRPGLRARHLPRARGRDRRFSG